MLFLYTSVVCHVIRDTICWGCGIIYSLFSHFKTELRRRKSKLPASTSAVALKYQWKAGFLGSLLHFTVSNSSFLSSCMPYCYWTKGYWIDTWNRLLFANFSSEIIRINELSSKMCSLTSETIVICFKISNHNLNTQGSKGQSLFVCIFLHAQRTIHFSH